MTTKDSVCVDFVCPRPDLSTVVYALVNGAPTLVFAAFLAWQLRASVRKLRRSQSQIMLTYYAFLWSVNLLNVVRCIVLLVETREPKAGPWNALWLLTSFALVLLEVSVVVFLLQGYMTSGREALVRTLWVSGSVAFVDTVVKLLVIRAGVPLFMYGGTVDQGVGADMRWSKWSFWMCHALCFLAMYLALLILPHTKWRDRLPARPSFYRYVFILFLYNLARFLGAILIGCHVLAGYCVYGVATFLYFALYPPLIYWTFLSDFFRDSDLDLDLLYYEEMKESGYFEDYDAAAY